MLLPAHVRLYPHWLDGEFVRISTGATGPRQDTSAFLKVLKIHALLGTELILSDVQVFDSAAVLALFADEGAVQFLKDNRDFLDLKVDPDQTLGDSSWALAARGLARISDGWTSSVFVNDEQPIRRLKDQLIDELVRTRVIDKGRPLVVEPRYSEFKDLLEAARAAICYFGQYDSPQLIAQGGQRTNYYDVLNVLKETTLEPDDRMVVENTLAFINRVVEDEGARARRSSVRRILDKIPPRAEYEAHWNNIVQAWNYSTQVTLQPDGGSAAFLRGSVCPGSYLDRYMESIVPLKPGSGREGLVATAEPPTLPYDLDQLTWQSISHARRSTVDTMNALSKARVVAASGGGVAGILEPLRDHFQAVVRCLGPGVPHSHSTYLVKAGKVLLGVIGAVNPLTWARTALDAAEFASVTASGVSAWLDRRAMFSTLMTATWPERNPK